MDEDAPALYNKYHLVQEQTARLKKASFEVRVA